MIAHTIFNGVVLIIILSGLLDDADKELGHALGHGGLVGLLARSVLAG